MKTALELQPAGLYCPEGDFYIDPWHPVARAVITHAHSDHARVGAKQYLCAAQSVPFLRDRLGSEIAVTGLGYEQVLTLGSVKVSLHPAGHILGSSQIRIEHRGHVTVVTGDYKREPDVTCAAFETIPAHLLVTESTFGLPIFRWPDIKITAHEINAWWRANQAAGLTSILYGYALGKSQRLLSMLDSSIGSIYIHGALHKPTEAYRHAGVQLPETQLVSQASPGTDWSQVMVLAVPSAHGTTWVNRFRHRSTAMASGWMQVRGSRRRRSMDRGFVVSDHVDWPGLLHTIQEIQPEQVWVTHGFSSTVSRHLVELGLQACPLETKFVGESLDDGEESEWISAEAGAEANEATRDSDESLTGQPTELEEAP